MPCHFSLVLARRWLLLHVAKLRRQHTRARKGHSLFSPRTIFLVILLITLGIISLFRGGCNLETMLSGNSSDDYFQGNESDGPKGPGAITVQDEFLPLGGKGQLVKHEYYALSYSEEHEQAEWVAYELTKESIQAPNVERSGDFRRDNMVNSTSADREDYKRSGYDRGHLVPAGDMAFSRKSMSETFYLSNMSPQVRAFNGGIWRELEENVRDWSYKFRHLYIVTGPVLSEPTLGNIGRNKVSIPAAYFKVLLDVEEPGKKGIGFIMPNEATDKPIQDFMVSIDEVEKITGLDFFAKLLDDSEENYLESTLSKKDWPVDQSKYKSRVKSWNNR